MNAQELAKGFSISRTFYLLKNKLLEELPVPLIAAGVVFGLNLVFLLLGGEAPMNTRGASMGPVALWGLGIMLLGLYLSSRAFKGMHGRTGTEWLLLPATIAEKYLASLAWLFIVWPVASALGAMASSAALAGLQLLGGENAGYIWHPFNRAGLELLLGYWSFAPVLIAGSSVFRKNALVKTLGVITAVVVVLMLILVPLFMSIFGERDVDGSFSFDNGVFLAAGNERLESLQGVVQAISNVWRFAILPGFALAFAYFRAAEKEASDEVQ
jgi:hypothetical protein